MLFKYEELFNIASGGWTQICWNPDLVVAIMLDLNHNEAKAAEPVNPQLLSFVCAISYVSSTLLMFTQAALGHRKPSELFFYHYGTHITFTVTRNRHNNRHVSFLVKPVGCLPCCQMLYNSVFWQCSNFESKYCVFLCISHWICHVI